MRVEWRDDITKNDILLFLGLLLFLIFWSWFVFYSNCILTSETLSLKPLFKLIGLNWCQ